MTEPLTEEWTTDGLLDLVEQCYEDISDWGGDCKSCGYGPGVVRELASELLGTING